MADMNSTRSLTNLFHKYYVILEELSQNAARDRKLDNYVIPENELHRLISGKINNRWGQFLVLSQIGYLRINLFAEYYARITVARETGDFDNAIRLMDEYLKTIAKPFLEGAKHRSISGRFADFVSHNKTPQVINENTEKWNKDYEEWFKTASNTQEESQSRDEKFKHMMDTFNILYTYSFSPENFPPLCTEPTH